MHRGGGERVQRWERRTGRWLVVLAVAFLAAYAIPILWPDLPRPWPFLFDALVWGIWGLFIGDFLVRVAWAEDRWGFLRSHPFDLAVLLLPMLRPLRLLQLVKIVMVIERRTDVWTRGKLAVYVGATTCLLVVIASLAILDAERGVEGASIHSFDDALWWSLVTVTTVGYGDTFPVTGTGRVVALAMMLCGIGLLGFVTGSLATWVLEQVGISGKQTQTEVGEVLDELRTLRAEVASLRTQVPAPRSGGEPRRHPEPEQPRQPERDPADEP